MKKREMLRVVVAQHGAAWPLVLFLRIVNFVVAKVCLAPQSFTFQGEKLHYFVRLYNGTFRCERTIEVPIARAFLHGVHSNSILEIGNVLSHYGFVGHTVVDKYEHGAGVVNEDIVSYRPDRTFDRIVSISTFEHVGFDEEGQESSKVLKAFESIQALLSEDGQALVTVPLGYNDYLDQIVRSRSAVAGCVTFFRRKSAMNSWAEVAESDLGVVRYGVGSPCANALAVCLLKKGDT